MGLKFKPKDLHYYLAYHAVLEQFSQKVTTNSSNLIAKAYDAKLSKRSASVITELTTSNNDLICRLSVDYHVISDRLFKRKFKSYNVNTANLPGSESPYKKNFN